MATKYEIIAEERARIQQIMECPEGLARPKSARHLALYSDTSPALAIAMMGGLPKENALLDALASEGPVGIVGGLAADAARGTDKVAARKAELAEGNKAWRKRMGREAL